MFEISGAADFFVPALGLAEFYAAAMPLSRAVTGLLTAGLLAITARRTV
mgnify:CR=1 FL=1